MKNNNFVTQKGTKFKLPIFFPDATHAVVKTLDTLDIEKTKTLGIIVNTYHLYRGLGSRVLKKFGSVGKFMKWDKAIISDSGGFQIMSIAKTQSKNAVSDKGVVFHPTKKKKLLFTPEKSISFQTKLKTDLFVVLDDFTPPSATRKEAEETVRRTIEWAKRSKDEFEKHYNKKKKPYLIGVVQGGDYLDLREKCTKELVKIGFDGLGYGGWPVKTDGSFNYDVAKIISNNSPKNYLLYGLGIGKPEEIVGCFDLGFTIFDCVLPTRDARHKRLYVYNANSINKINVRKPDFYSFYTPDKQKYYSNKDPISRACDCILCTNYSKGYLAHLFRTKELSALRLASIHNLRFYSLLMEKLGQN